MTDAELKAIEIVERERMVEKERRVEAGFPVWDWVLEQWVEAPR